MGVVLLKIEFKKISLKILDIFINFIVVYSCKLLRLFLFIYLFFFKIVPFTIDIFVFRYHDKYTTDNVIGIIIWLIVLYILRIPKLS